MAHLVCKAHGKRVMTFDGKVLHRDKGVHCKNTDLRMGSKTWRVTKNGLRELVHNKSGKLVEVPIKHLTNS